MNYYYYTIMLSLLYCVALRKKRRKKLLFGKVEKKYENNLHFDTSLKKLIALFNCRFEIGIFIQKKKNCNHLK